jgi:hypothetical protein
MVDHVLCEFLLFMSFSVNGKLLDKCLDEVVRSVDLHAWIKNDSILNIDG